MSVMSDSLFLQLSSVRIFLGKILFAVKYLDLTPKFILQLRLFETYFKWLDAHRYYFCMDKFGNCKFVNEKAWKASEDILF